MSVQLANARTGETDEIYLLNSKNVMLTPSRFEEQLKSAGTIKERSQLELVIDTQASREGAAGRAGTAEYAGYRGTAVLGAYQPVRVGNQAWTMVAEMEQSEAYATTAQLTTLLGVLVAVAVVLVVIASLLVARSIANPITAIARALEQFAGGDLNRGANSAARARLMRQSGEIGVAARGLESAELYLQQMADLAQRIAEGDLTVDVTPRSEKDELGHSFHRMTVQLRELVGEVQQAATRFASSSRDLGFAASQTGGVVQQVSLAAQTVALGASDSSERAQTTNATVAELSMSVDGIARGAVDQARQVQAASETVTQMTSRVEQVATKANGVAAASTETRQTAQDGAAAVAETVSSMSQIQEVVGQASVAVEELGKLSQRIGAVVETIDDIAEQTNLLALNAAIEAARAGEQGRGFAVVADEVRKLAERSGRETKQIAELIQQVQAATGDAVTAMSTGSAKVAQGSVKADEAGAALANILRKVDETVMQVSEIATAAEEMAAGARGMTDTMQGISAVVEENSAATEQMAEQAGRVADAISGIAAVAEEQSSTTEEMSASAEEMSAQVQAMGDQAQELAAVAAHMQSLVDRFKLADEASNVVPLRRAA
jgi:methyl-accepting chemotaxis protein